MAKATHKTKDGRTAKKGLYYNINKKKKEGRKPRKPGSQPKLRRKLMVACTKWLVVACIKWLEVACTKWLTVE